MIENCYSVGMVTGKSDSNPLIGKKSSGSVKNCYYEGVKEADSLGTGKTAEEMKAPAFVADLGAAFIADMKNPVNEGYPIFAFQDNTPKYEAVFTVNPENADFKDFRC